MQNTARPERPLPIGKTSTPYENDDQQLHGLAELLESVWGVVRRRTPKFGRFVLRPPRRKLAAAKPSVLIDREGDTANGRRPRDYVTAVGEYPLKGVSPLR